MHNALKLQKSDDGRGKSNKKTSETKDNRIVMLVKRDPLMSLRQISVEINNEMSSRTIRRR